MRAQCTFVQIVTFLSIVRCNDVARVTRTNVAAIRYVNAMLFASAHRQIGTCARMMTAQLIRIVATIVGIITDLTTIDTFTVGTFELRVRIASFLFASAQCYIVLVRSVSTIIDAVTDLIACHATMIGTLEPTQCVTIEIRTNRCGLVTVVATIVGAIAQIRR